MDAWTTHGSGDLERISIALPTVEERSILVRVAACGVCRTDLHVVDGELLPHRLRVTPGHQIIADVTAVGTEVTRFGVGDRVGVAWLASTCGGCPWCLSGRENLCDRARFTGWDTDGGYAEYTVADERYVYPVPTDLDPVDVAPMLCAGIIGYRALMRARLPVGGTLGIYGFGSSGYLTSRIAVSFGAVVHVMTRGERNRDLARSAGVESVGEEAARPPEELDAAIVFAPAGELVPKALRATRAGGTVVLAGIHMSAIPRMSYAEHLFRERDLRTVTANTREDGESFLRLASRLGLRAAVTRYPDRQTNTALDDLRSGRAAGSLVIDRTLP